MLCMYYAAVRSNELDVHITTCVLYIKRTKVRHRKKFIAEYHVGKNT